MLRVPGLAEGGFTAEQAFDDRLRDAFLELIYRSGANLVLLPIQDAAARIEAAMGSLAGGDLLTSPAITMSEVDLESVREECRQTSEEELRLTLSRLADAGAIATGRVIHEPPVDALHVAEEHLGIPVEVVEPAEEDDRGRRHPPD